MTHNVAAGGRKQLRRKRNAFSSPPVWCDQHLWEASLSPYASRQGSRRGRSGTPGVSGGDLLGNTVLTHCPNRAARRCYLCTLNKGVKSLPCILCQRSKRRTRHRKFELTWGNKGWYCNSRASRQSRKEQI